MILSHQVSAPDLGGPALDFLFLPDSGREPCLTGKEMIARSQPPNGPQVRLILVLAAVGSLLFGAVGAAQADSPKEDALRFVRTFGQQSVALLADNELEPDARRAGFRRLIVGHFDLSGISRFVLGRHWKRATDAERIEYRQLFEKYVVTSVDRKLTSYAGETLEVGVARTKGDTNAVVTSQIVRPTANPVRVDWRLKWLDGDWRIIDMVVEGVSLALTHRNEFDAVIKQSGGQISALLQRLREQAASRVASTT